MMQPVHQKCRVEEQSFSIGELSRDLSLMVLDRMDWLSLNQFSQTSIANRKVVWENPRYVRKIITACFLERFLNLGVKLQDTTLRDIVIQYAPVDPDRALQVLDQIEDLYQFAQASVKLAKHLEPKKVVEILTRGLNLSKDEIFYCCIICSICEALAPLNPRLALQSARVLKHDPSNYATALVEIARFLEIDERERVIVEFFDTCEKIREPLCYTEKYLKILEFPGFCGTMEKVECLIKRLQESDYKWDAELALSRVVEWLAPINPSRALELSLSFSGSVLGLTIPALCKVAKVYFSTQHQVAKNLFQLARSSSISGWDATDLGSLASLWDKNLAKEIYLTAIGGARDPKFCGALAEIDEGLAFEQLKVVKVWDTESQLEVLGTVRKMSKMHPAQWEKYFDFVNDKFPNDKWSAIPFIINHDPFYAIRFYHQKYQWMKINQLNGDVHGINSGIQDILCSLNKCFPGEES